MPESGNSTTVLNLHAPAGTLYGRLLLMGGPYPGRRALSRGTIFVTGGSSSKATVNAHGSFSVSLKPGTYTITATSPDYGDGDRLCVARNPVRVADGRESPVDVYCSLR